MSDAVLKNVRGFAWTRLPVLARVLAPVLLLAGALRLTALEQAPFSMDESATAGFAALSWDKLLHGLGRLETNLPAFYGLEKLWTGMVGTSDPAFRILPALSGLAGVAVIALLTKAMFGRGPGCGPTSMGRTGQPWLPSCNATWSGRVGPSWWPAASMRFQSSGTCRLGVRHGHGFPSRPNSEAGCPKRLPGWRPARRRCRSTRTPPRCAAPWDGPAASCY